jgi:hypothetical protein
MRRLTTKLATIGLLGVLATPGAAASSQPIDYLALGDSLAFGYSPLVAESWVPATSSAIRTSWRTRSGTCEGYGRIVSVP